MWERMLPTSFVYYKNPPTQNLAFHAVRSSSVRTYSLRHFNLGDKRTRLLLRKFFFFIDISYCFMYCHVCLCNKFVIEDLQRSSMQMVWDNIWAHFSLDNGLELVWTMVWNLSDQGSLRSGTRLIRGGFERTSSAKRSSSAHSYDQRSLRSGTVWSEVTLVLDGLIRDNFERDLNLGSDS